MKVFYFCNGADENCSREGCYKNGGDCCYTTDRNFARETEGVRNFEELEPGFFFEIDPDQKEAVTDVTDEKVLEMLSSFAKKHNYIYPYKHLLQKELLGAFLVFSGHIDYCPIRASFGIPTVVNLKVIR